MKTKKQYLEQIRQLKAQSDSRNAWGYKWMNYAHDLSAKLDVALARLETISKCQYYADEMNSNTENKAEKTATIGLRKIARMQERKP